MLLITSDYHAVALPYLTPLDRCYTPPSLTLPPPYVATLCNATAEPSLTELRQNTTLPHNTCAWKDSTLPYRYITLPNPHCTPLYLYHYQTSHSFASPYLYRAILRLTGTRLDDSLLCHDRASLHQNMTQLYPTSPTRCRASRCLNNEILCTTLPLQLHTRLYPCCDLRYPTSPRQCNTLLHLDSA